MKIDFKRYLLATKEFPLEFACKETCGELTDDIEEAYLFNSEKQVKDELDRYDEPEKFQSLPVNVTYEF